MPKKIWVAFWVASANAASIAGALLGDQKISLRSKSTVLRGFKKFGSVSV
jgi:hypothetical protein